MAEEEEVVPPTPQSSVSRSAADSWSTLNRSETITEPTQDQTQSTGIPCEQPSLRHQDEDTNNRARRRLSEESQESLPELPPLTQPQARSQSVSTSQYNSSRSQTQFTPITNSTLGSLGNKCVILVKFTDSNSHDLLKNPLKINRIIKNSILYAKELKDIRINHRKSLIAIEYNRELGPEQIVKVNTIKKLDDYNVECYLPNSDVFKVGVISGISLDIKTDEIKSEINAYDENKVVHKVERMKRKINNNWEDSLSIKLTFQADELPEEISFYFIKYKVRPYIASPMQCYKCQRLGHTSKSCKSTEPRCLLCGENHSKDKCTSEERTCANCKGSHSANSNECRYIKNAKEVENIKAKHQVTYRIARQMCIDENNNSVINVSDTLSQQSQNRPLTRSSNPTYSQVLSQNRRDPTNRTAENTGKTFREMGTQTDVNNETNNKTNTQVHNTNNDKTFYKKLKSLLLELLNGNITAENKKSQDALVDAAIRNNFGINLRDSPMETERYKRKNIDTTDEEEVLSNARTDDENYIFQTVEKRMVRKPSTRRSRSTNKKKTKTSKKD